MPCDTLPSDKYVLDKCLQKYIGTLKEAINDKDVEYISWVRKSEQLPDSLTEK